SDATEAAGGSPNPSQTTVSGSPSSASTSAPASVSASATGEAIVSTCSGGWKVPGAGSELATFPIQVIKEMSHHAGSLKVVDMRYFVGVESPPNPDKPYLQDIERWYVKLYDPKDPAFRGRFLVERRPFGVWPPWRRSTRTGSARPTGRGLPTRAPRASRSKFRVCRARGPARRTTSSRGATGSTSPGCRRKRRAASTEPDGAAGRARGC